MLSRPRLSVVPGRRARLRQLHGPECARLIAGAPLQQRGNPGALPRGFDFQLWRPRQNLVNARYKRHRDRAQGTVLERHDADRTRLHRQLDRQDLERQVSAAKSHDRTRQQGNEAPRYNELAAQMHRERRDGRARHLRAVAAKSSSASAPGIVSGGGRIQRSVLRSASLRMRERAHLL